MGEVLTFGKPKPAPLRRQEWTVIVGHDEYLVRRHVDQDNRGFVMIHDAEMRPILTISALFPPDQIEVLILGYRTGHSAARRDCMGEIRDA